MIDIDRWLASGIKNLNLQLARLEGFFIKKFFIKCLLAFYKNLKLIETSSLFGAN